jgi:nicotinamidase/pyrazinamidase
MKVLLLVDIQNDFCPGGALAVSQGDETVAVANELINSGQFDIVVASQDWHPGDHVSFADNHPGKDLYQEIELSYPGREGIKQTMWPIHCVEHSEGAELHPDLAKDKIDLFVPKGTDRNIDSYSAFFDNERLQETGLRQALQEYAAERGKSLMDVELVVCGLALDYCVAATARDARFLNIETTLAVDGCRAVNLNPDDDVKTLRELTAAGVNIAESREILGREREIEQPRERSTEIEL